jgi:hypothetical protein
VLKLMYLAKRKSDFTHTQFAARWRKHGALAMSLPLWRHMSGYVQADVLHPTPVPGTSEGFDGVGILWAPSDDMWRNPEPEDERGVQTLLEDEHHTFGHPIPEVSLIVDEEVRRDAGEGRTTAFLYFRVSDHARSIADNLERSLDDRVEGIVLNTARNMAAFAEPTTPHRAIIEISARNSERLSGAMQLAAIKAMHEADVTVITRKAVLWG